MPHRHSRWTPKSILALRHYDLTDVPARRDRGRHRRTGRAAAGDGVRHRVGLSPQAGIYCAIVTGLHHFRARRIARSRLAGPPAPSSSSSPASSRVRRLRPVHVHDDGGRHAGAPGRHRPGSAVRFIPRPVVVGFTNGIAVLIASTQIRDFFGLQFEECPATSRPRMMAIGEHPTPSLRWRAVGVLSLATIVSSRPLRAEGARYVVALVAGTRGGVWVFNLPVETVGSTVRRHALRPAVVAFQSSAPC